MSDLIPVRSSELWRYWNDIEPFIRQVADKSDEYSSEDIAKRIAKGTAQLWLVADDKIRAICVTEINNLKRRECNILSCAGDGAREWVSLLDRIGEWARAEGCEVMTLVGRKGWKRLLPRWKQTAIVLELPL